MAEVRARQEDALREGMFTLGAEDGIPITPADILALALIMPAR